MTSPASPKPSERGQSATSVNPQSPASSSLARCAGLRSFLRPSLPMAAAEGAGEGPSCTGSWRTDERERGALEMPTDQALGARPVL